MSHPLQEVRDQRATEKHNRDLGGLIKQAIADQIKTTGSCHADDLVDLYPEGEVDLCRRLATAQFGSMAARKLIRKDGWRPTKNPARKGGGGWIWKFTEKGHRELSKLAGVKAGGGPLAARVAFPPAADTAPASPVSLDSGESSTEGRDQAQGPGGPRKAEPVDATPGGASPEPLQLDLAKQPSMFDTWEAA